jgi:hypothetical protein
VIRTREIENRSVTPPKTMLVVGEYFLNMNEGDFFNENNFIHNFTGLLPFNEFQKMNYKRFIKICIRSPLLTKSRLIYLTKLLKCFTSLSFFLQIMSFLNCKRIFII